jgi:hypothetical protein
LPGSVRLLNVRLVPPDTLDRPTAGERILFIPTVLLPWVALYLITASLRLPGRAFQFAFEDRLPIYAWTSVVYQSIYLAVVVAPFLARTRGELRRMTLSAWFAMAVVFPFYWMVPSSAPRRPMDSGGWIARLLAFERDACPPSAAFPSFHVLWVILIARVFRPAWIGGLYIAAITASCITTGMHYIPDVLASLVLGPVFVAPRRSLDFLCRAVNLAGKRGTRR